MAFQANNKVNVVVHFGYPAVGRMSPVVGMEVKHGIQTRYIVALDSGNYQVSLSNLSTGVPLLKAYPHELYVTFATATGSFSWPSGDGSVKYNHSEGMLANGVPDSMDASGVYFGGDGLTHNFSIGN